MIDFEVTGFTKGTRRRRHQIICANSESSARAIAGSRNIEVTSIQPVPEEHASEAQLNYAFAGHKLSAGCHEGRAVCAYTVASRQRGRPARFTD